MKDHLEEAAKSDRDLLSHNSKQTGCPSGVVRFAFQAAICGEKSGRAFLQASTDARISDCRQRGLLGPM